MTSAENAIYRNEPLADDCREVFSRNWGVGYAWYRTYIEAMYLWLSNINLERPNELFSVPVLFQTPERAFADKIRPTINRETVNLPIISFTLSSIAFDRQRLMSLPAINGRWEKHKQVDGTWIIVSKPMPWQLNFNVTCWGRYFLDLDFISYNLLSRFTPDSYLRPADTGIPSKIALTSMTDTSTLEPGQATDRILRHDYAFQIEAWMPLPERRVGSIQGVDVILASDFSEVLDTDISNVINVIEGSFDTGPEFQSGPATAQVIVTESE
jgi:hypothetical protein